MPLHKQYPKPHFKNLKEQDSQDVDECTVTAPRYASCMQQRQITSPLGLPSSSPNLSVTGLHASPPLAYAEAKKWNLLERTAVHRKLMHLHSHV